CVEGDVVVAALSVLESGVPARLHYGVADAKAWEVGLGCGGEIDVLVQPIGEDGYPPALMRHVLQETATGRSVTIGVDADDRMTTDPAKDAYTRTYAPPLTLILTGAVHISQALAPLAKGLGYDVKIVDPRGSFAADERFSGMEVDDRWPDEALADWRPGPATAVVALTHDPKLDDPALQAALASDAFYIAALGSRRSHAARLERLQDAGADEAALRRIHGPAGLPIGAANPEEIALSIAAQMVAAWRGALDKE
ncbi:MAG: XdhC family protein, partial [Pacificimonas sp.]